MGIEGLTDEDAMNAATAFVQIDTDGSGEIDVSELRNAFNQAGHKITGADLRKKLQEWNMGSSIPWADFVDKFNTLRIAHDVGRTFQNQTEDAFAKGLERIGKGSMKSYHSYSVEDRESFAEWCNMILGKDADLKHLMPIQLGSEDLFEKCKDGILLCKLINSAIKDTIDERSINKVKAGQTAVDTFRRTENLNLALQSAKAIGATVINVGAQDIVDGRGHLILGLIWQIIEIGLMAGVTLEQNPNIAALLDEDLGEELSDLRRLGPEEILLRWINFHLANDKSYVELDRPKITNFKGDLQDSIAYVHLLAQIQPEDHMPRISHDHKSDMDPMARATYMLGHAERLGVRCFVRPQDIVNKKEKLNLAFIANLFNHYPALEAENIEIIEETREEKTYRNWMNSLGTKPRIKYLYNDIKNGVALYNIMKQVNPKAVEDSKIKVTPPPYKKLNAKMTKICNLDNVCKLASGPMGFHMVGTSGMTIFEENKKLILGLLWQMMRAYSLKVLSELGDGKPVKDADILKWTNDKLGDKKISSFGDPTITTSMPIYRVINKLAPNTIDLKIVNTKSHDKMDAEEKHSNARYAISQARKLGATVFTLPDDVTEGKSKMITMLFASLMVLEKSK